ncbi:MAG: vanadium-dependent haloperoxidase [Tabrizicola sp.]|uniref:vanadium-dependent haloperoxidase n=1 Tax=Tabrizicola sp. TaxID=2005166 RepID=UPI002733DDE2|nr:vanadium-dependent haloperoxidase [Tabrizicola sp.]MDP3264152.1 vanadium-dependent haloperoxidase [Tabrizicola sp.]MDP3648781.1 vanadium-dependent haloperoxidase [Paracoccaceae bacterium]MDZ4065503.1 vanadium-dependent haloperoxidase [Tabrizicola sp.]
MKFHRRHVLALPLALLARPLGAAPRPEVERDVIVTWYRLILELVRHTATYSPPVASRAFAYIGITAHEALASGNPALRSLAGQLNGLATLPARTPGDHDEACVLHAALAASARNFFSNTGPTGQRAMGAMTERMAGKAMDGIASDVVARSTAHGEAIAAHILQWSLSDGGAVIENMGFPASYTPGTNPQDWVPTSLVRQQQAPLLPDWGTVRPFAMPTGDACSLPAPPAYSEDPASPFFLAAKEVYDTVTNLTDEQRLIARFWSDDPMLSPTPPGHWIAIVLDIADRDALPADRISEILATLGIAMADAFIGCWAAKFEYDLLRPITYIRRHIDPKFEPLLNTPPFPEYPSGHSTQSGAAATVLTAAFGEDFAFDDHTHEDEGLPVRSFASFWAAAEEAGISRLYGGIHFRFGIDQGLVQGRCIGAYAAGLATRA